MNFEFNLLSFLTSLQNRVIRSGGWDFPGGPVVKTLPSTTGGAGSIPGQGTKIPHALWKWKHKPEPIL